MSPAPIISYGPYRILSRLGAGGMGEVYRARDERLDRDVALKVLSLAATGGASGLRRFETEARAASALNHPNIMSVFDVGFDHGQHYIVSELIDGESLRKMLLDGPMGVRQLLDVAAQIADGLAATHEARIVHRDLKPENILVTRDGRVKIVDFGIARHAPGVNVETTPDDGTQAPTPTVPGMIVGTVNYMSPEQARGAMVDYRADQFAFGLILYEMATGRQVFRRDTPVETLAAVMKEEPEPVGLINPKVPLPLRWVIERCLAKEPIRRYASTVDLFQELRQIRDHLSESQFAETAALSPLRPRRSLTPWIIGVAAFAAGLLAAITATRPAPARLAFDRLTPLAADANYETFPAWSPDGKTVAYVADVDGVYQVMTRSVGSLTAAQLTKAQFNCTEPFWAPDGTRVFYHSFKDRSTALWSVGAAGGAPELVLERAIRAAVSPDGKTMAFFRNEFESGSQYSLWVSSPVGAAPRKITDAPFGEQRYLNGFLEFAPDGRSIAAWIQLWSGKTEFWQVPYPSGTPKRVLPSLADQPRVRRFSWMPDSRRLVIEHVTDGIAGVHLWMADVTRDRLEPLSVSGGMSLNPAISRDGRKLLFTSAENQYDLVEIPVDGGPMRNLLATSRSEVAPTWSPSGTEYAFETDRDGLSEIWLRSRQTGWERLMVTAKDFGRDPTNGLTDPAFSPDGQRLAYSRVSGGGAGLSAIWISATAGGPPVRLTKATEGFAQCCPTWSPDGEWVAFISSRGGTHMLVKARIGGGDPVTVTENTARYVQWSPAGDWILHVAPEGLALVSPDGKRSKVLDAEAPLVAGWSKDGRIVYGLRSSPERRIELLSFHVATGETKKVADLGRSNAATVLMFRGFSMAPNGKSFATSFYRMRADIWMMEGLRQPAGWFEGLWRR